MASEKGKQILFSLVQLIILIAWLGTILAILYYDAYDYIIPSIIAFIALNITLGLWVHRFVYPVERKSYRKYLTIQTLFLLVWCPLLFVLITTNRIELISVWIVILVVFYISLGVVSCGAVIKNHSRQKQKKK